MSDLIRFSLKSEQVCQPNEDDAEERRPRGEHDKTDSAQPVRTRRDIERY